MLPDVQHLEVMRESARWGGGRVNSWRRRTRLGSGFTLIELILVMSMMLIVLSLIGPSLSGFFRGRTLDSEARRFLALTRFAQARAVSEGIPMILWIDAQQRRFGVESEFSYTGVDEQSKEFALSDTLEIEAQLLSTSSGSLGGGAGQGGSGLGKSSLLGMNLGGGRSGLRIRFAADGSIAGSSPDLITLREAPRAGETLRNSGATVYIAQSLNRLNYEIRTNNLVYLRR
ncbi:MAG: prepilin-type N-terminal cleavage/methylation domain-containing protein [Verrucomicrobiales bacterium]|nr:prepilin-type N-terminal cleavage/methylation domain-containing protein [Verrucomicrobiales bacterium]